MKYLKINNLLFLFSLFLSTAALAQPVAGLIVDHEQTPLIGASLTWQGTIQGTTSDENGFFKLERIPETTNLVVSYVGYQSDTLLIEPADTAILIMLALGVELEEVQISAKQRDNFVSTVQTLNIETIGSGELKKAACCNLSESFETNGTVNVSYSDAVTGAKEIEMLGLRGIYSRMMLENRPSMRGLGYPFGMEYIPGTWISNISIIKGAANVVNGYEGISGTINIELIKPFEEEKVFLNVFQNQYGRSELNVHLNHDINKKWSIGTLLHSNYFKNEIDHNGDKFIDMPQKQMLNGMFRAFYRAENLRAQINVQALSARVAGGQIGYETDPANLYGFELLTDRVEVFGKIGYLGFDNPLASLGWITNLTWHKNDGFFGFKNYDATQHSLYTNVIYQSIFTTTDHNYKLGASYALDEYVETFDNVDYSLTESVAGGFFEYAYTGSKTHRAKADDHDDHDEHEGHDHKAVEKKSNYNIVGGLRVDYHNLYGVFVTPRLSAKYGFDDNTALRLTAGRGYRTARILAENISVLTSAKTINVTEPLEAEDAWNAGINFAKNTTFQKRDLSLSLDLYSTRFTNQIVMDRETEELEILFYNLKGKSYSNSFLATVIYDLFDFLEIKLAYKLNDVKTTYNGVLDVVPLIAKHRGLVSFDFSSTDKSWKLHTTVQVVGPQRMPTLLGHENHTAAGHGTLADYQISGITPTYATMNAQLTKILNKKWEVYLGGENLTNYVQHNPIIGAADPFNADPGIPAFDASQIYAPIMGRVIYGGVRFRLEKP